MKGPRWCLKSLPSRPSTPPVLPWNPPQKPSTSCLPVAALARRRAASTASAPPEKSWIRVSPSGVRLASCEGKRGDNAAGDASARLLEKGGKAGPRVAVEKPDPAGARHDGVSTVHVEPEGERGPPHRAGELGGIERVADHALLLVVEPAEPRGRPIGSRAGADPVELDEVALDVRLDDGLSDTAGRQRPPGPPPPPPPGF